MAMAHGESSSSAYVSHDDNAICHNGWNGFNNWTLDELASNLHYLEDNSFHAPSAHQEAVTAGNVQPIRPDEVKHSPPESEHGHSPPRIELDVNNVGMLCPICQESEVVRHYQYGGRACLSCRSFFRRAVQSETHSKFHCHSGQGQCAVEPKRQKRKCKYCRFQRCLRKGGMKINLVRTHPVVKGRDAKKQQRTAKNEREGGNTVGQDMSLSTKFSADEKMHFLGLYQRMMETNFEKSFECYVMQPKHFHVTPYHHRSVVIKPFADFLSLRKRRQAL